MGDWWLGPMLAFDFESTSPDPQTARPVSVAVVRVNATEGTSATQSWVVDAGVTIPDEAAAIHGYTTERVRAEGGDPAEIVGVVADMIESHAAAGLPVIAYNARYDCTLLERELERHGLPSMVDRLGRFRPVVDPLVLDKQVDRFRRGRRTLTAAAEHYRVRLDEAHAAAQDAVTAARLAWRLGQHDDLKGLTLQELHDAQVGWAREQALSLADYFRRQGKETEALGVVPDWPVQP